MTLEGHSVPIEFIELQEPFAISVASPMSGITTTEHAEEENERNTVSTDSSSVLSCASPGKTKQLWNGVTVYTVDKVYLDNVVEIPTKDEMSTLKNTIRKVVFPK